MQIYPPTCYHGLLFQRAGDIWLIRTQSLFRDRSEAEGYEGHVPKSKTFAWSVPALVWRCRAYIFPGVKNVPVDVSAHAQ